MHAWDHPKDPDPILPPETPEDDQGDPGRRPDPDPEAQRAPGAGQEDSDVPATPPMELSGELVLDGPGIARQPVGNDNIRDGTVGGVMGAPHAANGQGQGG